MPIRRQRFDQSIMRGSIRLVNWLLQPQTSASYLQNRDALTV